MDLSTNLIVTCPRCGRRGRIVLRVDESGNVIAVLCDHGTEAVEIGGERYYRRVVHGVKRFLGDLDISMFADWIREQRRGSYVKVGEVTCTCGKRGTLFVVRRGDGRVNCVVYHGTESVEVGGRTYSRPIRHYVSCYAYNVSQSSSSQ